MALLIVAGQVQRKAWYQLEARHQFHGLGHTRRAVDFSNHSLNRLTPFSLVAGPSASECCDNLCSFGCAFHELFVQEFVLLDEIQRRSHVILSL